MPSTFADGTGAYAALIDSQYWGDALCCIGWYWVELLLGSIAAGWNALEVGWFFSAMPWLLGHDYWLVLMGLHVACSDLAVSPWVDPRAAWLSPHELSFDLGSLCASFCSLVGLRLAWGSSGSWIGFGLPRLRLVSWLFCWASDCFGDETLPPRSMVGLKLWCKSKAASPCMLR
ncbi:hypothetical protein U1Q18_019030 [Sarracenia purpurea var. burkii]